MTQISLEHIARRRFGRTEIQMPVFSCGGMRYQQGWGEIEADKIENSNQENIEKTIHHALELGINHIETARGYGSSEMQLGWVLPQLPREKLIVQTKVGPHEDPQEFLKNFEKSFKLLNLEYIDLLAFHGINTPEILDSVVLRNGCLKIARQLQKEGRVRFIGFSTHGPNDVITAANATGEFDYLNLHYYFVNTMNRGAIEEAKRQDMGVFIISPTDKGGMLQSPPPKMKELCAPLSPMQFNDLWCLNHPEIHTLSIGAARPSDFDEHVESLQYLDNFEAVVAPIETRLNDEVRRYFGDHWPETWHQHIPDSTEMPNELNVLDILRIFTYAKSLDLVEWAKGRYNLLSNGGHWVPGQNLGALDEQNWAKVELAIKNNPHAARIPQLLREAHEMLKGEDKERLSKSD